MRITVDQDPYNGSWKIAILDYVPKVTTPEEALTAALALFKVPAPTQPTSTVWLDDARVSGLQDRVKVLETKAGIAWPDVTVTQPTPTPVYE